MNSDVLTTRVCLIRPPVVLPATTINAQVGSAPLGMAYIAGAIQGAGFPVTVIDSVGEALEAFSAFDVEGLVVQGLSASEIVARIPEETKIIGLSCMFANEWIYAKRIIQLAKKKFPAAFLVVGGEYPTSDHKYLLNTYPEIDCCALGEGEATIIELCRKSEAGTLTDLSEVKGISFRKNGLVVTNTRRERINDLETISRPAWNLIPLENYQSRGLGYDTRGKRSMPILASRGCPYQCAFCSSPEMWTTKWNVRDVSSLIDEISDYIKTYRATHFEFYDLTMVIRKRWIQDFCREILAKNLKFTWSLPSGTRSEVLDLETLDLMKRAGCEKISLSPESGSLTTLKRIRKQLDPDDFLVVARNCNKVGMIAKANIIFGFPQQSVRECLESWLFIMKLAIAGINDVSCFRFAPYPGSELFYSLLKDGRISQDKEYEKFLAFNTVSDLRNNKSWSAQIEDWQISFFMLGGMLLFYSSSFLMRPWRAVSVLYRLLTKKPVTMLERALDGMLTRKTRNLKLVD